MIQNTITVDRALATIERFRRFEDSERVTVTFSGTDLTHRCDFEDIYPASAGVV